MWRVSVIWQHSGFISPSLGSTPSPQPCQDGGIGRHEGLKIPWPLGHAGSTPALDTNKITTP